MSLNKSTVSEKPIWRNKMEVSKIYTALVHCLGGENNPDAQVLKNTFGGNLVWHRDGIGCYELTLNGAFPEGKTIVFITSCANDFTAPATLFLAWERVEDSRLRFYSWQLEEGMLQQVDWSCPNNLPFSIEVRVYA